MSQQQQTTGGQREVQQDSVFCSQDDLFTDSQLVHFAVECDRPDVGVPAEEDCERLDYLPDAVLWDLLYVPFPGQSQCQGDEPLKIATQDSVIVISGESTDDTTDPLWGCGQHWNTQGSIGPIDHYISGVFEIDDELI